MRFAATYKGNPQSYSHKTLVKEVYIVYINLAYVHA